MKYLFLLLTICFGLQAAAQFDIQGHRGCRGLLPENSIPGMLKAVDLGVVTLEMDLVISKDGVVLLSHEPWISSEICDSAGVELVSDKERYSIYQMNFEEIAAFDCGSKVLVQFPEQSKMATSKPSLKAVLDAVAKHCAEKSLELPRLNLETKSTPEGDSIFHPNPSIFVDAIASVVNDSPFKDKILLQSFDPRTLEYAKLAYPKWRIALLVSGDQSPEKALKNLSFQPDVYSPSYKAVTLNRITRLHDLEIRVIPWTVNDIEEARKLFGWGVDGLITDYPNLITPETLRALRTE